MPKMPKVAEPNTGGGLPFFNPYKGIAKPKVRTKGKLTGAPKVPKVPKAPKIPKAY